MQTAAPAQILIPRSSTIITAKLETQKEQLLELQTSTEDITTVYNDATQALEQASRDPKAQKGDLKAVKAAQETLTAATKVFDVHQEDLTTAQESIARLEHELMLAAQAEKLVAAGKEYDQSLQSFTELESELTNHIQTIAGKLNTLRQNARTTHMVGWEVREATGDHTATWTQAILKAANVQEHGLIAVGHPNHGSSLVENDFGFSDRLVTALQKALFG